MPDERFDDQLVLSCWKEIAHYLGKGVRTVQRWEQEWDLPVRRPNGASIKGPVAARPADLDRWLSSHWSEGIASPKRRKPPRLDRLAAVENLAISNSLILASRALRQQNAALVKDLTAALRTLQLTCLTLEVVCANGKRRQAVSIETASKVNLAEQVVH
jgi:hypothetical protein